MLTNHTREIRQRYQQTTHCVPQAEAQKTPKVKQFLELTRRWLLLAHGLTSPYHKHRQSRVAAATTSAAMASRSPRDSFQEP